MIPLLILNPFSRECSQLSTRFNLLKTFLILSLSSVLLPLLVYLVFENFIVSLVIGLCFVGITFVLAKKIISDLLYLRDKAREVSAGNIILEDFHLNTFPEIAELVIEFNSMKMLIAEVLQKLQNHSSALEDKNIILKKEAYTDTLTGVFNRKYLLDYLKKEFCLLQSKQREQLALIFFDIDHFKRFNDDYGHDIGDVALKTVSSRVFNNVRKTDILARYGGEEFIVVMPDCPIGPAHNLAEKLRLSIADNPLTIQNKPVPITSSFGVAVFTKTNITGNIEKDIASLLKLADDRLYKAKERGRNQVVSG